MSIYKLFFIHSEDLLYFLLNFDKFKCSDDLMSCTYQLVLQFSTSSTDLPERDIFDIKITGMKFYNLNLSIVCLFLEQHFTFATEKKKVC